MSGASSGRTRCRTPTALVAATEDAELFLYPGDRHLFADPSLSSYDAEAASPLTERVLGFIAAR